MIQLKEVDFLFKKRCNELKDNFLKKKAYTNITWTKSSQSKVRMATHLWILQFGDHFPSFTENRKSIALGRIGQGQVQPQRAEKEMLRRTPNRYDAGDFKSEPCRAQGRTLRPASGLIFPRLLSLKLSHRPQAPQVRRRYAT